MEIVNRTPFAVAPFMLADAQGAETLLVVVKGTWRIDGGATLSVADEQAPIHCEPVYSGAAGASSLLYDSDLVLEKPGTDCALIGHAWAPSARATHVDVSFAVGPVRKTVRVFGERVWIRCLGFISKSRPAPFEKIPLVYERAFGGADTSSPKREHHEFFQHNPVGRGFLSRKSRISLHGTRLPNIEDPASLIKRPGDRPPAAGFGLIPPYWQPRAGYAGTYDDTWRKTLSPLPPRDLDPRFHSSAACGLCSKKHLEGNERIVVEGACRRGGLLLTMPGVRPRVAVRLRNQDESLSLQLDGVIVEPDAEKVVLTWRGSLCVQGRARKLLRTTIDL